MRNMIDVNKEAFSNLISQFLKKDSRSVPGGARYIKTDPDEKNWLKLANDFEILDITPNVRLIQFNFDSSKYFATIGANLDTNVFDNSILEEVNLNAGIITLLISKGILQLEKKANLLEFYNEILFQHKEKDYLGHDFLDILNFTEQIYLYRLPEFSVIKTNEISRVACFIFAQNPEQLILDFEDDILELMSELSLTGSDYISYKIFLGCLFSTTYKHAFLELYRLIERLFPINYLKEFHTKSASNLSFLDFCGELENITKWRPSEDDAIEKIFDSSKATTKKYFQDFHDSSPQLKSHKESKYFYSLRNSIVHFRANHIDFELTSHQWNLLLTATLYLLDEQYSIHNKALR